MPRPSWRMYSTRPPGIRPSLSHRDLELIPAIAAQRSHDVAGEALGVEPGRDVLHAHDAAVHHRDVLFAIPVVRERDDLEPAEPARQLGDGFDLDADVVRAEPVAVVVAITLDQLLERADAWKLAARLCHGPNIACVPPSSTHSGLEPLPCSKCPPVACIRHPFDGDGTPACCLCLGAGVERGHRARTGAGARREDRPRDPPRTGITSPARSRVLSRGKLDYSTDDAGRLSIEWTKVAKVTSPNSFHIERGRQACATSGG